MRLDCTQVENEVGSAIKAVLAETDLKREDLHVTTKARAPVRSRAARRCAGCVPTRVCVLSMTSRVPAVGRRQLWNDSHARVEEACRESLGKLGLDYIDLYLMHCACACSRLRDASCTYICAPTRIAPR